jgi:fatty acid kinase fatty acid binding subunit
MSGSGEGVQKMAAVALITDSSACLPAREPHALEAPHEPVHVVPIVIHLSDGDILGDTPAAADRVYDALRRKEPVKSSAPSAVEYLAAIEETRSDDIVVITPAEEFTTMYRNACVAADLAGERVAVVDSRTAAAAQGLVVLEAAEAAAAGGSLQDVAHVAEDAAGRAELVAAMEGLEYIRKSGRVPPAALGLARHLGVRPVFRLQGGTVERLGVPRSPQSAISRVAHEARTRGFREAERSVLFHAADPDRADALGAMLGLEESTEFSPSMGIHTGPGVVGVAWLRPAGEDGP